LEVLNPGVSRAKALGQYLESCRKDEVEVLRQLSAPLSGCPHKIWVLSVVTKQDLWSPSGEACERHYLRGEYGVIMNSVAEARGTSRFRHEYVPCSLVVGNYLDGEGAMLKKNVSGYGHEQSVESVRRILEIVDALRKWGSE
jgi:hypothetical protein